MNLMRLWHTKLIPFLPKSQLLAQWRELNSIYVKEDRHVLINYIYEYPKDHLKQYTSIVLDEMIARGFQIRTRDKMERYFGDEAYLPIEEPFNLHHDDLYLTMCYYNLYEKYIRKQKDFSTTEFEALQQFYKAQKRQSRL